MREEVHTESGIESTGSIKNIAQQGQDNVDRRQARPFQAWRIERGDASGVDVLSRPVREAEQLQFSNKEKEKRNASCYHL